MPPLYVVHQNAKIRIRNSHLQVEVDDDNAVEVISSQPLGHVNEIVLFGNIGITTPAIATLLSEDIHIAFLSEDGAYRGQLTGTLSPHVPLRRAQYRRLDENDFVLEMARGFVLAKLQNQRALLQRRVREQIAEGLDPSVEQIKIAIDTAERKTTLSSLRGLEGASTAAYFSAFRKLFDPEWRFEKRIRRPPPDPVNVLLSLGYTLMAQLSASAVQTVGLDPYAGFLHEFVYNRPALALDLMEEFRPVVDGVVLWAARGGQITPHDFSPGPPERPVILSEPGLKRFLQAFEQRMSQTFTHPITKTKLPLRQCLVEQARQVAARINNGSPGYTGMGFK